MVFLLAAIPEQTWSEGAGQAVDNPRAYKGRGEHLKPVMPNRIKGSAAPMNIR